MRFAIRNSALGFTLIELMVTVALLAVLLSLAAPSFQALLETQRMRAAAFDLMADLTLARNEALKRGDLANPVTLRPTSGDATHWESGWSVMVGTEVVSRKNSLGNGVTFTGPALVTFDRNGRVSSATTVARFALVNSSANRSRCISLDPSGRPKSATTACPP
ncbi:type IV fimbrial biogenesis protein FimT [Acidovorax sp. 69]|uniref:GspH/FimT family pseudopilin n=1 Tax=Acidovorax sp. 69 TaxID=2035202 RepID=UPI000C23A90F|nr:GspH/FimT family pseudopilin [Acidovorax sp. 69]PJI95763.1 type IV fimbrial biogenesis protein FimT [Acidovorax sp. 69]